MAVMTGLSGNEIYCLHKKGLSPGDIVIGNSVYSMGFLGSLGAGISTLAGGEVTQVTEMVHQGRLNSYTRMAAEANKHGGVGITGVTNELIQQAGNVEFLSIGSCLHQDGARSEQMAFSSSADGQELYCQMDAGFRPIKFVFGNVAYSIGVGGGLGGMFKSMQRGRDRAVFAGVQPDPASGAAAHRQRGAHRRRERRGRYRDLHHSVPGHAGDGDDRHRFVPSRASTGIRAGSDHQRPDE